MPPERQHLPHPYGVTTKNRININCMVVSDESGNLGWARYVA
jgi:hypothetical protein